MAIIKNRNNQQKTLIKAKINQSVLEKIEQYCEWSGIFDIGYFIEEAAEYVFKKDLEWKQFKKDNKISEA